MCGICGFNWEDKKLIQKMTASLNHRGPDDSGYFLSEGVSLGHRRLSVIDLRKVGRNPMSNVQGTHFIIFNGEVYNFRKLREDLEKKGYQFKSNTDTEVVLNAYTEYGAECLEKFNGMFAFAIWDAEGKELFLARDRLGIKPLYYYHSHIDKRFIFASEIKSILQHEINRKVSIKGFNSFLSFRFTTSSQTILENIYKLEPGSYLKLKGTELQKKKYWHLRERIIQGDINSKAKQLRTLLEESTRLRMIADVPLGAFLSGGLDSSLIVALMSKNVDKELSTFSVGFEHSNQNELNYAKTLSEHVGTKHHEVLVENKHLKLIPEMVWHMDEPIGDAATLPTYVVSKQARKKLTVVLAGEGGDELFAGYDRYKVAELTRALSLKGVHGSKLFSGAYGLVSNSLNNLLGDHRFPNLSRALKVLSAESRKDSYFNLICLFDDNAKKELLGPINNIESKDEVLRKHFEAFNTKNSLSKYLNFDINTVLCDDFLMKADKMTMAHSLEERVPLLDHKIAEFSMTLKPKYKLYRGVGKYVLRKAVKDLIPAKIIQRSKKGYDAPMNKWLQKDLYAQASQLFQDAKHELYNTDQINKMLKKFKQHKGTYKEAWFESQKLWSMYMFELWHQIYIVGEHKKSLQI